MTDYRNASFRLVDIGLDLRDATDRVGSGQWRNLDNVKSSQEGMLTTRNGRSLLLNVNGTGIVHTIRRLNDSSLLIGKGNALYLNENLITGSNIFSGNPLQIIPFKPALSSAAWTYISDSSNMAKLSPKGILYNWGITGPTILATANAFSTGNLNSAAAGGIVYDWRYTYYASQTGAESNPSPTVGGIGVVNQRASIIVYSSSDPQVDTIRLYRRGGVNGGSTWRLSVSSVNATAALEDNNSDSTIALNDELALDNDVPFTSVNSSGSTVQNVVIPYCFGPFLGKYILACGDPNQPGYVSWTNTEAPDGASPANNVSVTPPQEPLIGGLIFSSTPFVFSREDLYILDYGGPNAVPTFVGRKTPCGYGAVGPWAFCSGPFIFFVSRYGIYMTSGQDNPVSITEDSIRPIFKGETTSIYTPIDFNHPEKIRLDYAGEELHFTYLDSLGAQKHLIWHLLYKRWKSASSGNFSVTTAYQDENQAKSRLYLGGSDGKVYESTPDTTNDAGVDIRVACRTGSVDLSLPQTYKEFGNLIMDADPGGGTITITPYLNSETTSLTPTVISGNGRQKFPISLQDTFAYSFALDFTWVGQAKIYQLDLMWRVDEEAIKHWEFPPTTHGAKGWQHVRDGYLAVRSLGDLTMSITVDGVSYPVTFPSGSNTNGEKRKLYFSVPPIKGKVFQYKIDSSSAFRLYGDECEIRVKLWNTKMGYEILSPFIKLGSDGTRQGTAQSGS